QQEVDDAQAESEVVGASLRVDERAGGNARDVPLGGDRGAVVRCFDVDPAAGRTGTPGGDRQRLASVVLDAEERLRLLVRSHGDASDKEIQSVGGSSSGGNPPQGAGGGLA